VGGRLDGMSDEGEERRRLPALLNELGAGRTEKAMSLDRVSLLWVKCSEDKAGSKIRDDGAVRVWVE
jgi:hypothetical protein